MTCSAGHRNHTQTPAGFPAAGTQLAGPERSTGSGRGEPPRPGQGGICTASRHGTRTAYTEGCRCPETRTAVAAAQRSYEKRRYLAHRPLSVDTIGVRRRVHALQVTGWPQQTIGVMCGHDQRWVAQLLRRRYVYLHNALLIRAVYDRLAGRNGPSRMTAARAAARGFEPPEAWTVETIDDPTVGPWERLEGLPDGPLIDEVLVHRAAHGHDVTLTRPERLAAVALLRSRGLSYNEIAARLHKQQRQIHRDLDDLGLVGTVSA